MDGREPRFPYDPSFLVKVLFKGFKVLFKGFKVLFSEEK